MDMRRLTPMEVHAIKVAELGLDSTAVDLTSVEAIAGALRRMASFFCPCSAATIVRGVIRPLRGLVSDFKALRGTVEETLEAMIAHGDILEHRDVEGAAINGAVSLLYIAPASFVVRKSGIVILLGITPDQFSALPDYLEKRVEYENHLRRLHPLPDEDLRADLTELGLIEVSYEHWLRAPQAETPGQYLSRIDRLLDTVQPSREIPGLSLLEPERPVRYYPGRWTNVRFQSGRFVGRRSQAYGADLWCYVQLRDGNPERLIDLPLAGGRWRGCDEAWHLQMAIDALRGNAQRFRITPGPTDTRIVQFFSPVPMWARRRWTAVGEPVSGTGCLFAYRLAEAELAEELDFVRKRLWLEELG